LILIFDSPLEVRAMNVSRLATNKSAKFQPTVFRLEDRLVPGETMGASMPWAGAIGSLFAASLATGDSNADQSTTTSHSFTAKVNDKDDSASVSIIPAGLLTPADKGTSRDHALPNDATDDIFSNSDSSDDLMISNPTTAPISVSLPVMNEHAITMSGASGSFAPHNSGMEFSPPIAEMPNFAAFDGMAAIMAGSEASAGDAGGATPLFHILGKPGPNASSPSGYSPAQMRHAYGFDSLSQTGAGITIAIVDAFNDPTIMNDLHTFDTQFSLADPNLTIAYAQGSQPRTNGGWAQEISIDVEWAHAIAPGANIMLVECASNSNANLFGGVDYATQHGAQIVSMSWRGGDKSSDTSLDAHFNHTGVAYVASSGDTGGTVGYPSTSPYVLSVGGTSLPLDSNGNLTGAETVWSGSGGGPSGVEPEPGYQTSFGLSLSGRGTPDVSYDADPNTGVSVFDSTKSGGLSGWITFGGTSIGAPQWAGLLALVDQSRSTPISTNNLTSRSIYSAAVGSLYASNYRDITSGSAGSFSATAGYDFCTGLGSPLASSLVPYLISH
jgi:hypothetical protein